MKIQIEKLVGVGNGIEIEYSSDYGASIAQWIGPPPEVSGTYDVEIDIDDDLTWGQNISATDKKNPIIFSAEDKLVLIGLIINSSEDGCIAITLGEIIILLDVNNAPRGIEGPVECHATNVKMYPINL